MGDAFTYNGFGEVSGYSADVSGTPVFATDFVRDKLGRIVQKTETVSGVQHVYDYAYDTAGRLIEVKKDSVVTATYTYDANGNRLNNGATYDDQDRLLSTSTATYTYTANGELLTKTEGADTTQYSYDVLGNLLSVTLPDATLIEYVVDGRNRRVGKKVNGVLTKAWLYKDGLNPIAELDGAGNVVSRFVYASRANVPDYVIKGSVTYRIVSDHLGSPRQVINTSDGTTVQQMEYDKWGNVLVDTNPGFTPFGFAGGLYDTDTKLVRFGARDYDPEVGRWTSKDPIRFAGSDSNLFGYVFDDPINLRDSTGLLAPAYHYDLSYYAAINHGATPSQANEFALKVWNVDQGTQGTSPDQTNIHAMAGDGQTFEDAIAAFNELISNPDTPLAVKVHAVQDEAAPWHRGQPWHGKYDPDMLFGPFFHLCDDLFPGDEVLNRAWKATNAILDKNNPWK